MAGSRTTAAFARPISLRGKAQGEPAGAVVAWENAVESVVYPRGKVYSRQARYVRPLVED
ncbi:hypothetical protein KDH_46980 [Dictyobacter sp. S3.2.2.5]|uniref:Uncharacterized protein n=1 Tax=Dictyobacter halimunensis TaxID=3026934 RepID=A0ABQ6FUB5_9CHLR|nr:hypothetical protein KDH_46980 [Dictyobacter sp. S3.2.2.5]